MQEDPVEEFYKYQSEQKKRLGKNLRRIYTNKTEAISPGTCKELLQLGLVEVLGKGEFSLIKVDLTPKGELVAEQLSKDVEELHEFDKDMAIEFLSKSPSKKCEVKTGRMIKFYNYLIHKREVRALKTTITEADSPEKIARENEIIKFIESKVTNISKELFDNIEAYEGKIYEVKE